MKYNGFAPGHEGWGSSVESPRALAPDHVTGHGVFDAVFAGVGRILWNVPPPRVGRRNGGSRVVACWADLGLMAGSLSPRRGPENGSVAGFPLPGIWPASPQLATELDVDGLGPAKW